MKKLHINKAQVIGVIIAIVIIILSYIFLRVSSLFYFLVGIALVIAGLPFFVSLIIESSTSKEKDEMFLEFARNLVESVKAGTPISKSIINIRNKDYGALNPYIVKLAHQLEWGYPLHDALNIFADDTKNMVIKRSVAIVIQAEKSGGDMAAVLEAVSQSVWEIKKVKEEQKSQAYGQVIQGYIIFFVFIVIMLVLQIYLIPKLTDISGDLAQGLGGMTTMAPNTSSATDLKGIFIGAIFVQGLFAGLMIGKFSEGKFKNGVKHSLIMAIIGYLLMATITGIFAPEEVTTKAALLFLIPYKLLKGKN